MLLPLPSFFPQVQLPSPSVLLSRLASIPFSLFLLFLSLLGWHPPQPTSFSLERYTRHAESILPLLYSARANPRLYQHYHPHAIFEDPVLLATGRQQIAAAFDSLRLVFRKCQPHIRAVLVNEDVERVVLVLMDVEYHGRWGGKVWVCSVVRLQFGRGGEVIRHEDRWWGIPLGGTLLKSLRKVVGQAVHCFVRWFPPSEA
eukprot:GFKZ01007036.1.p1 GENE.GFKZ01007036.1~~GFKZ01007036.1.p1  ORF type:complete len:201 (+),score=15.09 GFKZ01007036.1:284-886(+)